MSPSLVVRTCISLIAGAALAAGCAGYTVTKQATPNPFAGQAKFAVEAIQYGDGVNADAEVQQEIAASFREELSSELGSGIQLVDAADADTPAIRVIVLEIREGTAMNLQMDPAVLDTTVQLVKGGEVLDELRIHKVMNQAPGVTIGGIPTAGYAAKDRLGALADDVAEEVADYIEGRIKVQ